MGPLKADIDKLYFDSLLQTCKLLVSLGLQQALHLKDQILSPKKTWELYFLIFYDLFWLLYLPFYCFVQLHLLSFGHDLFLIQTDIFTKFSFIILLKFYLHQPLKNWQFWHELQSSSKPEDGMQDLDIGSQTALPKWLKGLDRNKHIQISETINIGY